LTVEERQRDKGLSIGFVDLVDRTDIRVIEGCGGPSLSLEALPGFRITKECGARNLRATKRPSFVSSALNTTPMPPSPSFSTMR